MTARENRTARITILIDPKKKSAFERLCAQDDVTPSQKIRQLMRSYIEEKLGPEWRDDILGNEDRK